MPVMITGTIKLDKCWVCPSRMGLHDHHCIPQAYGGVDGPQVTLCGAHHTYVHSMSLRRDFIQANCMYEAQQQNADGVKLWYLIQVIKQARTAWQRTQTVKPIQLTVLFEGERALKLRRLKKLLGSSSQQKTLEHLVDAMYAQLTNLKPHSHDNGNTNR